MRRIIKGLDLPIAHAPEQKIHDGPAVRSVAVLAADYVGLKPTMQVAQGDAVKLGQLLFTDKKNPDVRYTAPAGGKVTAVNRGAKRAFQSVVIEVSGDEAETFRSYAGTDLTGLTRDQVTGNLLESGLWTAVRTRPFSGVPSPQTTPHSIFVTAIDSHPLAARPEPIINTRPQDFEHGLQIIRHLTDGPVYVIKRAGATLPGSTVPGVVTEEFEGPHPAGLVGTHIHLLDPVSDTRTVWHIGYQDVMAIGHLFNTGNLDNERIIALGGPGMKKPRLIRTQLGAAAADLTANELADGDVRVVSGSVLSGRTMSGVNTFLGRYHLQVSALLEGREREFLGWQKPGLNKFSIKRVFASAFLRPDQKYEFTTSTEGSRRAMVPIGMYEKVMPLDILPTFLLRALIVGDTDQAAALGALELDEEDLALCTFVCPGKYDYGPILRENLTKIANEG